MKTCGGCKLELPIEAFEVSGRGRRSLCQACYRPIRNETQRRYNSKNRDRINRYNRNWNSKNSRSRRSTHLKRKYGISLEEYERMLEFQDGRCNICDVVLQRPCVDHDHETKKVRGLLCRLCNAALGGFRDSSKLLYRAIEHLENS